jgi:site-specific DNA-methyltransferase (adenine-specific)
MVLLSQLQDKSVDLIFADPPFNCGKKYGVAVDGRAISDVRNDDEYFAWCKRWLDESVRALKPGGALFVYHIARWNTRFSTYLQSKPEMQFQHWITVNINGQMPIKGKLLPQGYSLLYFTNGKPKTFHRIWTPIERCRKCGVTVKDYGGHLKKREAKQPGIVLSDVWNDITAVRHRKFKSKKRKANQLSTKILERVVRMASDKGDLIVDPFGGSGTTYGVCEEWGRRWKGSEVGSCDAIVERLTTRRVAKHRNNDIVDGEVRR